MIYLYLHIISTAVYEPLDSYFYPLVLYKNPINKLFKIVKITKIIIHSPIFSLRSYNAVMH